MNVCIVSTFEGTTEDYMEMFNATKESTQGTVSYTHLTLPTILLV